MRRESRPSRTRSRLLKVAMIRRSLRKDSLSLREESELSRLEEPLKLRLAKSKTESMTLFAPPELLLLRESFPEEEPLCFTHQKDCKN